jgi:hypothetical protein
MKTAMKNVLPFAFCLLPFLLPAQKTARRVDGIAAYVNNHTITVADVWREMSPGVTAANEDEVFNGILANMIDAKLVLDEAKATSVQIAAWAVDARVQEILDREFKGDHDLLATELARARKTHESWRQELEEVMIVQYMVHHNIERVLVVPPKDIRAFYADRTDEFFSPEKIDVSMIVLEAFEGEPLAKLGAAIIDRLAQGVEFARVAQTLDTPASRELGKISYSNMGFILPVEELRPELAEALAKIADNANTPLLVIEETGYILRRNATEPPRQIPLEEAWPFIESRLRDQLARERYLVWIEMLRKKYYIKAFGLPSN